MRVHLRANSTDSHTRFTVFVNGANAGELCMREDEAVAFYMIVWNGMLPVDEFVGSGSWGEGRKNDTSSSTSE